MRNPSGTDGCPARAGTLARLLGELPLFRDADPSVFRDAEPGALLIDTATPTELIRAGDAAPFDWFLITGSAALAPASGPTQHVTHENPTAGYPLAHLRPSGYTVTAAPHSRLVRLEQSFVKRIAANPGPARFVGGSEAGAGSWQSHPFAIDVERQRRNGTLAVPAMPGISARISRAMQDEDFAVTDLTRLISADPAIAGALLKTSNSALFRGVGKCETLHAAVVRLGMTQTRNLVLSLAAKALFVGKVPWVRQRLQTMWRHAVEIGAYMMVLARIVPGMDTAKSLLAGLLHEIGAVPILTLAEQHPSLNETPGIVSSVLANVVPSLSAEILTDWGLTDFAESAPLQENWLYDHDGGADYTDLLLVAHLHALIRARRFDALPRLTDTPAYGRLQAHGLSATTSVTVLEEAREELAELRGLLSG